MESKNRLVEKGVQGIDMMGINLPLMMVLIFHAFIISAIIVFIPKLQKNILLLIINVLGLLWGIGVFSLFQV